MKPSRITLGLLLAFGAQPVCAADLLDLYRSAQSQDASFAAARAARDAGQEKLTQGRSLMLPSVNLTANSTKNDVTIDPMGLNKKYDSRGYTVSLVQPLFREQNWAVYTESELQVAQSEAQFKQAEQDLVLRVAQAYFDVLIAQDSDQL